ncbi:MAG: glutamate--cysteine ligase [Pyrinomonadaceae bacterium]
MTETRDIEAAEPRAQEAKAHSTFEDNAANDSIDSTNDLIVPAAANNESSTLIDPQTPISKASLPQLADYLRGGAKPAGAWQCGVEFEVLGYTANDFERLDAGSVQHVLAQLAATSSSSSQAGNLIYENDVVIEAALDDGGRVTVEPGGQVEFSGAPRSSLIEIDTDIKVFLARLHEIAEANACVFLAAGFDPLRRLDEQRWFPKARYDVMRPYLAAHGARAWDMMARTCAVQVNLDYDSETDLAKKFILGNRLAPIVTAIFANSPFEDGAPSVYKSTRAAAWLATDNARAGVSTLALENNFSPEEFVDYALRVPMIFVRRKDAYVDAVANLSFSEFLEAGAGAIKPQFQDWTDHLTTIFTEARLKQYIELRSADGGDLRMALALAALWRGLMYDREALDEALRIAPKLKQKEMRGLQEAVARDALATQHAGVDVLHTAKDLIAIAAAGIERFAPQEAKYLDVLREQVIEDEVCPADILLRNYRGAWHGSMRRVIEHLRIA